MPCCFFSESIWLIHNLSRKTIWCPGKRLLILCQKHSTPKSLDNVDNGHAEQKQSFTPWVTWDHESRFAMVPCSPHVFRSSHNQYPSFQVISCKMIWVEDFVSKLLNPPFLNMYQQFFHAWLTVGFHSLAAKTCILNAPVSHEDVSHEHKARKATLLLGKSRNGSQISSLNLL